MSENKFGSGFLIGSILGGVVGGVLGTLLATRDTDTNNKVSSDRSLAEGTPPLEFASEAEMEIARHNLEDKIAQLNSAIDEVRHQLSSVNGATIQPEQPEAD